MLPKKTYLRIALVLIAGLCYGVLSFAQSESLWLSAESIRNDLFQSQVEMFSAKHADDAQENYDRAVSYIENALDTYQTAFASDVEAIIPDVHEAILADFDEAQALSQVGDEVQLAYVRGKIWGGLLQASYYLTGYYLENEDINAARSWLAVREYRQSTRVSLIDNVAEQMLDSFEQGDIKSATAMLEIQNDLRDTYLYRLRFALEEVKIALDKGFQVRASEWMGHLEGYYHILEADYLTKLGDESATELTNIIDATQNLIVVGDLESAQQSVEYIADAIAYYQPVVLTPAEVDERAQMLYMFTNLIAVEYQDAVRNGEITIAVEYQEAQTFMRQAQTTFTEVQSYITDADAVTRLNQLYQETHDLIHEVGSREEVHARIDEALLLIESNLNIDTDNDADATFSLIDVMLDEMVDAVRRGAYDEAEQLRLEAYALFDFGPEPRLMTFSPDLQIQIEGLFWQGYQDTLGLSRAIEAKASAEDIQSIREQLDVELNNAKVLIGDTSSEPFAVMVNAAVIVFREGLEAVVIIVALMAGMVGANQHYRRPLIGGTVLALVVTFVTWWLMQGVLSSLRVHGEKLEAVVSVIAIVVLLLITNWFFHKVYWNEWIANFHRQKKMLLGMEVEIGQTLGLVILGFTSVYREGFETVLFLQALVLDAGFWVVVQGVLLGSVGIGLVGYLTFRLQKRLPYRRMLVWTGVLIGVVLITMVGNTVHVMQVVGWLPITPIRGLIFPDVWGVWLGIFATWEGIILQFASAAFVIGSYYLAEWQSKQRRTTGKPEKKKA